MSQLENLFETLRGLPDQLAGRQELDRLVEPLSKSVGSAVPPGSPANTALAGTWLGHPLHPLLTDLVIGSWSAAALLDALGGRSSRKAARRLVAIGILASLPTAASGLNDWSTLAGAEQRIGLVHGAGNAVGTGLMMASYRARRRGHWMRGKALTLAALGAAGLGGYLGGDLSYRRAVGVDQTAALQGESEWTPVADESEVKEAEPTLVTLGDMPVLLTRDGGEVRALADRCAHQGGPLHEGRIQDGCVTCPWHQSRFRLGDGRALSGPTAHPQPVLQVRVAGGKIEVRRQA